MVQHPERAAGVTRGVVVLRSSKCCQLGVTEGSCFSPLDCVGPRQAGAVQVVGGEAECNILLVHVAPRG